MSNALRLSSCLLIATALVGCNKSAPATPDHAADAAAAASTPAAAEPESSTVPEGAPAGEELAPIALDMGKVKAWMQAQKNLAAAAEKDPKMGDPAQNISEENSGKYAARLEADPTMRAVIAKAGLSTSDFARIGETLIAALMAQGALESGQLKELPDGVDPASVDFVKQHEAELSAMMGTGAG